MWIDELLKTFDRYLKEGTFSVDFDEKEGYVDFHILQYFDLVYIQVEPYNTFQLNKRGYELLHKFYDRKYLQKEGLWSVYVSYDGSGYHYWTKNMRESNHAHIVVSFTPEGSKQLNDPEVLEGFLVQFMHFQRTVMNRIEQVMSNRNYLRREWQ